MAVGSVAVGVTEGVPLFEVAIPCEVFGRPRLDLADPWYDFRVCAASPGQTRVGAGFVAGTPFGLDDLVRADTVIVPACENVCDRQPPDLVEAVRAAHARGARIVSLCTGAFVLAAAGLLDGRRATVHWLHAPLLASQYPRVDVDPSVLYVDGGDVLTSAGVSAGLDLCLHVVRLDLGSEVANLLARRLVVPAHRPGGQAQYVEGPMPRRNGETLAPLLQWAQEHLHEPLTLDDLAARCHVTSRTLIRRFQAATGDAPHRWLLGQRIARARWLLESTDDSIDEVATHCGLGTDANLRHHFTRVLGVAPTEYRRAFRARDGSGARSH